MKESARLHGVQNKPEPEPGQPWPGAGGCLKVNMAPLQVSSQPQPGSNQGEATGTPLTLRQHQPKDEAQAWQRRLTGTVITGAHKRGGGAGKNPVLLNGERQAFRITQAAKVLRKMP